MSPAALFDSARARIQRYGFAEIELQGAPVWVDRQIERLLPLFAIRPDTEAVAAAAGPVEADTSTPAGPSLETTAVDGSASSAAPAGARTEAAAAASESSRRQHATNQGISLGCVNSGGRLCVNVYLPLVMAERIGLEPRGKAAVYLEGSTLRVSSGQGWGVFESGRHKLVLQHSATKLGLTSVIRARPARSHHWDGEELVIDLPDGWPRPATAEPTADVVHCADCGAARPVGEVLECPRCERNVCAAPCWATHGRKHGNGKEGRPNV